MAIRLRWDRTGADPSRRWMMGTVVSAQCRRVSAALISAEGTGLNASVEVVAHLTTAVPNQPATLFAELSGSTTSANANVLAESLAQLRRDLAETVASAASDLLAETGMTPAGVLTLAQDDPGLWTGGRGRMAGYLGLCDPARLAELTGMNVIDAFPARDVSTGGLGGPLCPLAEWLLLRNRRRARVLLDLGRTLRLTYLPADQPANRILAFDVAPGTHLLDLLVEQLTCGQQHFDPGGTLAAQGRRIPELLDHWLADPMFHSPLPRWHPRGVRPERFLLDAVRMAVAAGWSVRDMLCTCTHFLAESISEALSRRLPDGTGSEELLLTGGGQHNGMLIREIGNRLPGVAITHVDDQEGNGEALGAACIGILGLFYIDQVPANHPMTTGTELPRVLGRLTPGSPQSWQALVTHLGATRPAIRPLRSAL